MPKRKPPAPPPGKFRSDGRKHDTGLEKPYRPKPADFRETYIAMGWDGIEEHYGTNWRVVRRWIEEEGREALRAARSAHVRELYADRRAEVSSRARRRRYVLGQTLTPKPAPKPISVDAARRILRAKPEKRHGRLPDDHDGG